MNRLYIYLLILSTIIWLEHLGLWWDNFSQTSGLLLLKMDLHVFLVWFHCTTGWSYRNCPQFNNSMATNVTIFLSHNKQHSAHPHTSYDSRPSRNIRHFLLARVQPTVAPTHPLPPVNELTSRYMKRRTVYSHHLLWASMRPNRTTPAAVRAKSNGEESPSGRSTREETS